MGISVMTGEVAEYLERHGAVTGPVYPDDEAPSADENFREALTEQRRGDCARIFESAEDLIFEPDRRVAYMRVSGAIAILRQDLNVGEMADSLVEVCSVDRISGGLILDSSAAFAWQIVERIVQKMWQRCQ